MNPDATHVHVADIRECQDTSGLEDDDYADELFTDWTRGTADCAAAGW